MPLDEDVVRLARGANLATVATLMPDGQPQALPAWIDTDGEHLILNTVPTHQKVKNLTRDPRVTVLILADDNGWDWAEVRGHVVETITGQPAIDHINAVSNRYTGKDYERPIDPEGRIMYKIAADRINTPKTLWGRR